jgi:hypothetical protein
VSNNNATQLSQHGIHKHKGDSQRIMLGNPINIKSPLGGKVDNKSSLFMDTTASKLMSPISKKVSKLNKNSAKHSLGF